MPKKSANHQRAQLASAKSRREKETPIQTSERMKALSDAAIQKRQSERYIAAESENQRLKANITEMKRNLRNVIAETTDSIRFCINLCSK